MIKAHMKKQCLMCEIMTGRSLVANCSGCVEPYACEGLFEAARQGSAASRGSAIDAASNETEAIDGFSIADLLHPQQREYTSNTIGSKPNKKNVLGRNCAQKILKELKLQGPPILLESVVNYLMVEVAYVEQENKDVWGQYLGGRIIIITKGLSANVHRSTLAHELGHVALNHDLRPRWDTLDNMEDPDPHEQEAWDFARELLMPAEMLKKEFKT